MVYVIIAAGLVIFWLLVVDRPILYVQFKQGQLTKVKGHLPPTLKHHLADICTHATFSGHMKAYQRCEGIKLMFSRSVPKNTQQRIRNIFPFSSFKESGLNKKRMKH